MRARGWLRRRRGEDGENAETKPAAGKLLWRNLSNSALQSFRNACPAGTGDGDGRRREGRQLSSTVRGDLPTERREQGRLERWGVARTDDNFATDDISNLTMSVREAELQAAAIVRGGTFC
jgi:hypothetical protein